MKKAISLTALSLLIAACGGGGGGSAPPPDTDECSLTAQKQFVLEQMRDIYFWYDSLPAVVDIDDFATPEELLEFLIGFSPNGIDRRFSFLGSAAADTQFFGEGKFAGFGFSSRFEAADDLRITRVISASPAELAGFGRGQRILEIDGRSIADIQATIGISEALGPSEVGVTRQFRIRRLDGSEYEVSVTKDVVTIEPVPQARIIDRPGGPVGYLEFVQFIGTAEGLNGPLEAAFADFRAAGVVDLVLDLRYNGGGLVRVANLTGDYLGGFVSEDEIFSETLYNDKNTDRNSVKRFIALSSSLNLSRLVVLATRNTASASELVINSLEPHAAVSIVGTETFGKPVGQVGITFCEKILRPTAFETVNSLSEGGYFDGLPADCDAPDDLDFPIGSDQDPMLGTALSLLETGGCPAPARIEKPRPGLPRGPVAPPWRSLEGFF